VEDIISAPDSPISIVPTPPVEMMNNVGGDTEASDAPAEAQFRRNMAAEHITIYDLLSRGIECSLASKNWRYDVIVDHVTVLTPVRVAAVPVPRGNWS
jgi:hypothetical protein